MLRSRCLVGLVGRIQLRDGGGFGGGIRKRLVCNGFRRGINQGLGLAIVMSDVIEPASNTRFNIVGRQAREFRERDDGAGQRPRLGDRDSAGFAAMDMSRWRPIG